MKRELSYYDINASDFSPQFNALLDAQRKTYEANKAAKLALVKQAMQEVEAPNGDEIVSVAYTRWGQLQILTGKPQAPKAKAVRATLSPVVKS